MKMQLYKNMNFTPLWAFVGGGSEMKTYAWTKRTTLSSSVPSLTYLGHKSPRLFFIFLHGSQKCSDPKARDLGDHMNSFEPRVPVTTVTPDSRTSLDMDGTLDFDHFHIGGTFKFLRIQCNEPNHPKGAFGVLPISVNAVTCNIIECFVHI